MSKTRGHLKYGDCFFLSVNDFDIIDEDGPRGHGLIFVAAESISAASLRLSSNEKNLSHLEGVISQAGEQYPPDFFTSCIIKIQTGIGAKAAGQPVRYGSTLRLMIHMSNKYIISKETISQKSTTTVSNPLQLGDAEGTIADFVVSPGLKKRKEGDLIFHNDIILLKDNRNRFWQLKKRYQQKKGGSSYSIVCNAADSGTSFRVGFFLSHEEDGSKVIKGGDVVQLHNRQTDHFLSIYIKTEKSQDSNEEIGSGLYKFMSMNSVSPLEDEFSAVNTITSNDTKASACQAIPDVNGAHNHAGIASCFNYWVVESAQEFSFSDMTGKIAWDEPIRLKHMITCEYLAVEVEATTTIKTVIAKNNADKSSIFQFISLNDWKKTESTEDDFVTTGLDCLLKNEASGVVIGVNSNSLKRSSDITSPRNISPRGIEGDVAEDVANEDTSSQQKQRQQQQHKLVTSMQSSDVQSFFLIPVRPEDANKARSLLVHQQVIIRHIFTHLVDESTISTRLKRSPSLRLNRRSLMDKSMTVITQQLKDVRENFFRTVGNKSDVQVYQKVVAELGFIEIILKVTKVAHESMEKKSAVKEHPIEEALLSEGYELLSEIVRENALNADEVVQAGGLHQVIAYHSHSIAIYLKFVNTNVVKMIMHASCLHSGEWGPLRAIIDALTIHNKLAGRPTLTKSDITLIVDQVHDDYLGKGEVPPAYLYRYLADCCRVPQEFLANKAALALQRKLQNWICDAVLGTQETLSKRDGGQSTYAFKSIMIYHTVLMRDQLLLDINTANKGRPACIPDPDMSRRRKIVSKMSSRGSFSNNPAPSQSGGRNSDVEDPITFYVLLMKSEWKKHLDFFCTSLHLLAAICENCNMEAQLALRRVLPLEHVICALRGKEQLGYQLYEAFLDVLRNCYVNSAFLPAPTDFSQPIVLHWKRKDHATVSSITTKYDHEMEKVFCLNSHEDEIEFHMSKDADFSQVQEQFNKCVEDNKISGLGLKVPTNTTDIHEFISRYQQKKLEQLTEKSKVCRIRYSQTVKEMVVNFFADCLKNKAGDTEVAKTKSASNDESSAKVSGLVGPVDDGESKQACAFKRSMLRLIDDLLKRRFFDDPELLSGSKTTGVDNSEEQMRRHDALTWRLTAERPNNHLTSFYDIVSMYSGCLNIIKPFQRQWKSGQDSSTSSVLFNDVDNTSATKLFNKKFGIDATVSDYFLDDMELKLCCCRVAQTCIEILQLQIADSIWSLFPQTYEKVKEICSKLRPNNTNKSLKTLFQEAISNVLKSTMLDNRNDYRTLWGDCVTIMEKEIHDILNSLYYNHGLLRSEVMLLVKKAHTFRSRICSLISTAIFSIENIPGQAEDICNDISTIAKRNRTMTLLLQHLSGCTLTEEVAKKNPASKRHLRNLCHVFEGGRCLDDDVGLIGLCQAAVMTENNSFPSGSNNATRDIVSVEVDLYSSERKLVNAKTIRDLNIVERLVAYLTEVLAPRCRTHVIFDSDQMELFECCFHFLFEFSKGTPENMEILRNFDTIQLLLAHRSLLAKQSCHGETNVNYVIELLISILASCEHVEQYLTPVEIFGLVNEVKYAVLDGYYYHAENCIRILNILVSVQHSAQSTSENCQHILSAFNNELGRSKDFQCLLFFLDEDGCSSVSHLCDGYNRTTNRMTGKKGIQLIIMQALLNTHNYSQFEEKVISWDCLERGTLLQTHLLFLDLVASCLQREGNSELEIFKSMLPKGQEKEYINFIFDVVFIDKIEIRQPYLRLLNVVVFSLGFWYKDESNLFDKYRLQFLGIFKLFALDLRQFKLSLCCGSVSASTVKYRTIQQDYVMRTVLPFLRDFFRVHIEVDNSASGNSEAMFEEYSNLSMNVVLEANQGFDLLPVSISDIDRGHGLTLILRFIAFDLLPKSEEEQVLLSNADLRRKLVALWQAMVLHPVFSKIGRENLEAAIKEVDALTLNDSKQEKMGPLQTELGDDAVPDVGNDVKDLTSMGHFQRLEYLRLRLIPPFVVGAFLQELEVFALPAVDVNCFRLSANQSYEGNAAVLEDLDDAIDEFKDPMFPKLCSVLSQHILISTYLFRDREFIENFSNEEVAHMTLVAQQKDNWSQWTEYGGRILTSIINHLNIVDDVSFMNCESYWIKAILSGVLNYKCREINPGEDEEEFLEDQRKGIRKIHIIQDTFVDKFGVLPLIINSVSVANDDFEEYSTSTVVRQSVYAVLEFSVALLETGNRNVQDKLMQHIMNRSDGMDTYFLRSIRLILKYQKQCIADQRMSLTLDDNFKSEVCSLLRFLQLLCEGGNIENKNILRDQMSVHESIRIVGEIGSLVHQLGMALQRDVSYIEDDSFYNKFGPGVRGFPRKLISWFRRDEIDSFSKATGKHLTNPLEPIHIKRLIYYAEMLNSGMNTLAEFAVGPCFENQIEIINSGAYLVLGDLFEFFGSLQLDQKVNRANDIPININGQSLDDLWQVVGKKLRFELNQSYARKNIRWAGDDPACIELLYGVLSDFNEVKPPNRKSFTGLTNIISNIDPQFDTGNDLIHAILDQKKKFIDFISDDDNIASLDKGDVDDVQRLFNQYHSKADGHIRQQRISFGGIKTVPFNHQEIDSCGLSRNIYIDIHFLLKAMIDLEKSAIALTSSLLEGRGMEVENDCARQLTERIEDSLVPNTMSYWDRFLHSEKRKVSPWLRLKSGAIVFEPPKDTFEREFAFQYYALVMRVTEFKFNCKVKETIPEWITEEEIPIEEFIARIEVHGPIAGNLVAVYFPIPNVVREFWTRSEVSSIRKSIVYPDNDKRRSSADEKVRSFVEDTKKLTAVLRHQEFLSKIARSKYFWFITWPIIQVISLVDIWIRLMMLCALALNIYLLMTAVYNPNGDMVIKEYGSGLQNVTTSTSSAAQQSYPAAGPILLYLGIIHLCLAIIALISFLVVWGIVFVKAGFRENPHSTIKISRNFLFSERTTRILLKPLFVLGLLREVNEEEDDDLGEVGECTPLGFLRPILFTVFYIVKEPRTDFLLLVVTFAFVGYFFNPILYSVCLVHFIPMSRLTLYVIRAFIANFDQVAVTVALTACLMYIFVSWFFMSQELRNQYDLSGHMDCEAFGSCYRVHLDYGWSNPPNWDGDTGGYITDGYFTGSLYNFLYQFIINLVAPAMVSGIIIDSFSQLREMKDSIEADIEERCFICNIDKDDFEQGGVSFEAHIRDDHNMWKYLWFQIHLFEKYPTEYTGIETFCKSKIDQKMSARWLPVKKALALQSTTVKYDLYSVYKNIEILQRDVNKLNEVNTILSRNVATILTADEGLKSEIAELKDCWKSEMAELDEVSRTGDGIRDMQSQLDKVLEQLNDIKAKINGPE